MTRASLAVACALVVGVAHAAVAQTGGTYDLQWNTLDGGGGVHTGGTYTLTGTVGQPDAGLLSGGTYALAGGFWKGGAAVTGVGEDDPFVESLPKVFALYANAPNPFADATTLRFDLPRESPVRVQVFDLRGALVRELVSGTLPAGRYARMWDGRDARGRLAAGGVYWMRVETDRDRAQRRIVIAR